MLQLSAYKYASGAFVVVTLVFLIACTSSNSWRTVYSSKESYSINGLWRTCNFTDGTRQCSEYKPAGWIDASRTLMILAILFAAANVVYTVGVYITVSDPTEMKLWRATVLSLGTAFLTLVGMSVYTDNEFMDPMRSERGYAFTLGWSSLVLSLISAFTALVADRR